MMYYIRKIATKGAVITTIPKKFADKSGVQKPKDYT